LIACLVSGLARDKESSDDEDFVDNSGVFDDDDDTIDDDDDAVDDENNDADDTDNDNNNDDDTDFAPSIHDDQGREIILDGIGFPRVMQILTVTCDPDSPQHTVTVSPATR